MGKKKKKKRWYLSDKKKQNKNIKYCYYNDICRWKRDSFSNEVEITRGIVWLLKKRILKKIYWI